tara:strand:+ start:4867 stop:5073 length:207 start_codon:yes stop_codon:yes gene_type:complete
MIFLFSALAVAGEPVCDDLKKNMVALEIFLQDQEDHANECPKLKWNQPDIEVYKKKLVSQLPAECKRE